MKFKPAGWIFWLTLITLASCQKENSEPSSLNIIPNDFLAGNKYDNLIIEIQYVDGYAPTVSTLDNLKAFLQQRLNKTGGISFVQNAVSATGKSSYSLDDIVDFEAAHRTQKTSGKTLTAYFFFADADYSISNGSSKVLGVAYGTSSMALFEKTIRDFSGGVTKPSRDALETTVILHEFGHILGLVDNGTAMQSPHLDDAHGKHCTNKNCLMYFEAETSNVIGNMTGSTVYPLDAGCLADLKGNGGK